MKASYMWRQCIRGGLKRSLADRKVLLAIKNKSVEDDNFVVNHMLGRLVDYNIRASEADAFAAEVESLELDRIMRQNAGGVGPSGTCPGAQDPQLRQDSNGAGPSGTCHGAHVEEEEPPVDSDSAESEDFA